MSRCSSRRENPGHRVSQYTWWGLLLGYLQANGPKRKCHHTLNAQNRTRFLGSVPSQMYRLTRRYNLWLHQVEKWPEKCSTFQERLFSRHHREQWSKSRRIDRRVLWSDGVRDRYCGVEGESESFHKLIVDIRVKLQSSIAKPAFINPFLHPKIWWKSQTGSILQN